MIETTTIKRIRHLVSLLFILSSPLFVYASFAQDVNIQYRLSQPVIKDFTLTKTGYKTDFSNVHWQWDDALAFYEILTWEYDIEKDGPFHIAEASFLPQTNEVNLNYQAYLDDYMSQTGWSALNAKLTPKGLLLDPTSSSYPPSFSDFSPLYNLASPFMFLRGHDKCFKVNFTAMVPEDNTEDAVLIVYAYGQELPNDLGTEVHEITVPKDGQSHNYSVDFSNGTWNHRLVIAVKNRAKVNIQDKITVTQNLKKGDHTYRAVYYNAFTAEDITPGSAENNKSTIHHYVNDKVSQSILDFKKANKEGAYLGYRLLYRFQGKSYVGVTMNYSMYSTPYYIPGQTKSSEGTSNYLYLGYVSKEDPVSENVAPSGGTFCGSHLGAIKIPQSMFAKLREQGAKIVGVRFCAGAKSQTTQYFEIPAFAPQLPFAFLSEKMKVSQSNEKEQPEKNEFLKIKTAPIAEGWNEFFFDEPYTLTDKDFYVGFCAYDASMASQVFYLSDKVIDAGDNSNLCGVAFNYNDYENTTLSAGLYSSQALLIQAIVSIEKDLIQVEPIAISGESYYYNNVPLSFDLTLKNKGNIPIKNIKIEAGIEGHLQPILLSFTDPLLPGADVIKKITLPNFPQSYGKQRISAHVIEVNDQQITDSPTLSFEATLLETSKTFARNTLVDFFTDENCKNCPIAEKDFFEFFAELPEDIQSQTIFVFHHEGLAGDIYTMQYSSKMLPFLGVKKRNGKIVVDKATPKMMTNRSVNPNLSRNDNGILGSLPPLPRFSSVFDYAVKTEPAFATMTLTPELQKDGHIHVLIQGQSSELLDRNKKIYMTLLMTQDDLPAINQNGTTNIPHFVHNHVLRFVDDKGFMGTPVSFDEKGTFKMEYDIIPDLVEYDSKEGLEMNKVKDNQFIMLDGAGNPIDRNQTLSKINVIAVLHYAEDLPGIFDLTMENSEVFHNAVINAVQSKISNIILGADALQSDDLYFYIQGGRLHYRGTCTTYSVYSIDGIRLDPHGILEPGVYIVKATLNNGKEVTKKIASWKQ